MVFEIRKIQKKLYFWYLFDNQLAMIFFSLVNLAGPKSYFIITRQTNLLFCPRINHTRGHVCKKTDY